MGSGKFLLMRIFPSPVTLIKRQLSRLTFISMQVKKGKALLRGTNAAGPTSQLGQLADVDIRLLRIFKAVVECGGMTAAELELNIGASTVSRHIKDLETRLGLTLCRRGRAGFALTPEGERIYQDTLRLVASLDEFRAGVDDLHRRMGGQLSIAIFDKTASNPASRIPQALAAFTEQAPDVALELHVAPINTIERGLIDGRFQVGILPAHRSSESLDYLPLFDETMQIYCAPPHPWFAAPAAADAALDWPALRATAFAGLGYHSPNMELSHHVRLQRAATGFDQESIATLILSGHFVGFLPDHYAEAFVRRGQMRAVNPATLTYPAQFVAVRRRSPPPSRATAAFIDCLQKAHAPN
jgi:DNA-binding transcriptional LysR family regulator